MESTREPTAFILLPTPNNLFFKILGHSRRPLPPELFYDIASYVDTEDLPRFTHLSSTLRTIFGKIWLRRLGVFRTTSLGDSISLQLPPWISSRPPLCALFFACASPPVLKASLYIDLVFLKKHHHAALHLTQSLSTVSRFNVIISTVQGGWRVPHWERYIGPLLAELSSRHCTSLRLSGRNETYLSPPAERTNGSSVRRSPIRLTKEFARRIEILSLDGVLFRNVEGGKWLHTLRMDFCSVRNLYLSDFVTAEESGRECLAKELFLQSLRELSVEQTEHVCTIVAFLARHPHATSLNWWNWEATSCAPHRLQCYRRRPALYIKTLWISVLVVAPFSLHARLPNLEHITVVILDSKSDEAHFCRAMNALFKQERNAKLVLALNFNICLSQRVRGLEQFHAMTDLAEMHLSFPYEPPTGPLRDVSVAIYIMFLVADSPIVHELPTEWVSRPQQFEDIFPG